MWWSSHRICGEVRAGYVVEFAQDMWCSSCRICGGVHAGYVVDFMQEIWFGKSKLKLNQPSWGWAELGKMLGIVKTFYSH
jgi:hypothetical protein